MISADQKGPLEMTDFKVGDKVQIDPALVNSGSRVAPLGVVGTVLCFSYTSEVWVVWKTHGSWHHSWELVRVVEPPKKMKVQREDH
jgi:hypothetical protein